jgi:hypothetical protein
MVERKYRIVGRLSIAAKSRQAIISATGEEVRYGTPQKAGGIPGLRLYGS